MHIWLYLDRSDLEKEVAELRVQLCKASVLGEVEELKRALDCKEKERLQLSLQVKVCIREIINPLDFITLFHCSCKLSHSLCTALKNTWKILKISQLECK